MRRDRLTYLLFQYYIHELSEQEIRELQLWLDESPKHRLLLEKVMDADRINEQRDVESLFDEQKAWQKLSPRLSIRKQKKRFHLRLIRYAVAILAVIAFDCLYWLNRSDSTSEVTQPLTEQPDLWAAKENVTLSYNGKEKVLNSNQYTVKDTTILSERELKTAEILTIDVARGNTFSLILDDGTQIVLNSATRISFPRHFKSNMREVTLWYGEAYFQVAKSAQKPFVVHKGQSQIRVLGTSFNINAYANENTITTTLVEGEVSFSSVNKQNYSLTPGMQSCMNTQTGETELRSVNTAVYTAWIEGKFIFQSMELEAIMRQIERWYAVDVVNRAGESQNSHFRGTISRDLSLQQVLDILQQTTDLTFTLDERTITITQ